MKIKLNIGLVTNTGETLEAETVAARITQLGFTKIAWHVAQSATEPTLCWTGEAFFHVVIPRIRFLSEEFRQDCIACKLFSPSLSISALIGPNAEKWGEFNPAYFID